MTTRRRVAVVGSGLAGLSAAHLLSRHEDLDVVVYEADAQVGGRANTIDGAEHCARLFLDDYATLLGLFEEIPDEDGLSVREALRPLTRFSYTERSGWVENDGLYPLLSRGLAPRERWALMRAKRLSPLVAEQRFASSTNRYGSRTSFTTATQARILARSFSPRKVLALRGATDYTLLDPWTRHLRSRGVAIHTGRPVTGLVTNGSRASVVVDGSDAGFDAVVVTTFVTDAIELIQHSGMHHTIPARPHSHCKCFTIALDEREPILDDPSVRLYAHDGISVVVQPEARRCTALCTFSLGTSDDFVLPRVRAFLRLQHRLLDVRSRTNRAPREALFHATLVDPARAIEARPGLAFAGSWIQNPYLLDAGEGAALSAQAAVRAVTTRLRSS